MMKFLFSALFFFLVYKHNGQEIGTRINLIITVDDNIAITSIYSAKVEGIIKGLEKIILADYVPGSLSFDSSHKNDLFALSDSNLFLTFGYRSYKRKKQRVSHYKIEIKKEWFLEPYLILKIYNLDIRKYKRRFSPLDRNRNYTFEVDSPKFTFRRVIKR